MNKISIFTKTAVGWFIQVNCIILALMMLANPLLAKNFKPVGIKETESVEFARTLHRGWNLGNTLDASKFSAECEEQFGVETETLWGNPLTTKELFAYVRETGFDFVRIPVTYKNHFKMEPGYEIDKAWLDRVQQIVDYALECDLKVIINIHHDCTTSGDNKIWFIADLAHYDTTRDILTSLWSQIAERFKDYDNNLIFETLNEPAYANTKYQGHGNDESRYVLGKLNIETLNAIRATGGENENRFVMLPTHGACNNYDTNSAFVFPDDPHVLVSVHGYVETDSKFHDITVWHNLFMIQKFFLNKGYGTVIGEFGEIIHPDDTEERLQKIAADFKLQVEVADKFGVPSCFWDDGGEHHVIDRRTLTPYCAQTLAALTGYTQE